MAGDAEGNDGAPSEQAPARLEMGSGSDGAAVEHAGLESKRLLLPPCAPANAGATNDGGGAVVVVGLASKRGEPARGEPARGEPARGDTERGEPAAGRLSTGSRLPFHVRFGPSTRGVELLNWAPKAYAVVLAALGVRPGRQ